MNEIWKDIEEFSGFYEVSNLGRVRRSAPGCRTYVGKILKPTPAKSNGYLRVSISVNNKQCKRFVHVLVARAFITVPVGVKNPQVNHKGVKTDNRVSKLEWRSFSGNMQDRALRKLGGDGVHRRPSGNWTARYSPHPSKKKQLGTFTTKKAAQSVRDAAVAAIPHVV
jgi:hypothetical protein